MPCPYTFAELEREFPLYGPVGNEALNEESRKKFFEAMGWDDLIDNDAYANTCAMRVSVCLVRLGMTFPTGEIKILKGPHKDKRIKIRWKELSEKLVAKWGAATDISPTTTTASKPHQGVVAFEKLPGGYPGHIDVLDGPNESCVYSAYFGSDEMWVWPAKVAEKKTDAE